MLQEKSILLLKHLKDLKRSGVQYLSVNNETIEDLLKKLKSSNAEIIQQPPQEKVTKKEVIIPKKENVSIKLPNSDKKTQWEYVKNLMLNDEILKDYLKSEQPGIFGAGNLDADILFCLEMPEPEDLPQGALLSGESGQLFQKVLQAMGLTFHSVYLANLLPARPTLPNKEILLYALPYLKAQLDIVQPKLIVALGAGAMNALLANHQQKRMADVRGTWQSAYNLPLIITFHPSYLIRNGTKKVKRTFWEDMMKIMNFLNITITNKQKNYFL